jgi:hypothetical protein
MGPFQTTVLASARAAWKVVIDFGPMSRPIQPSGMALRAAGRRAARHGAHVRAGRGHTYSKPSTAQQRQHGAQHKQGQQRAAAGAQRRRT